VKASEQDGSHPRPQLIRTGWAVLDGPWRFAHDDADRGQRDRWYDPAGGAVFDREIRVPFPPESAASGIGDTGFHPVVWYRRTLTEHDLGVAADRLTLIHFGAVDHEARVWFDGILVGEHVGGQTPFTVDVTPLLRGSDDDEHVLVVRAQDDPHDTSQPRGKQDWERHPHGIWYHRTTGIWQSVWAETVPPQHVADLVWTADRAASVRADLTLAARPVEPVSVTVELSVGDEVLAEVTARVDGPRATLDIAVAALANGQDRARLLWSPEHPTLIDARVVVRAGEEVLDEVDSYLGLRTAGVGGGRFLLNGRPYYVRSVLGQGYWPDTHLASPGTDALRREVELIKELGFNAVRVHQKVEDPRFLFWADRLGLLVWGETAGAYEFSVRAVELLTREWLEILRRDRSHPSIVTWVPMNESWGVQDIATDPAQQAYATALTALTRAVDPTRPVVSNDGWEHVDSDILGIHDYTTDPHELAARYRDDRAIHEAITGPGPQDRRPVLNAVQVARHDDGRAPLMITEFGGVSHQGDPSTWGYAQVASDAEYARLLRELFDALRSCPGIAGFCYTQLADTLQEANGLLTADRRPKLPVEALREIVTGSTEPVSEVTSTDGWTKSPAAS